MRSTTDLQVFGLVRKNGRWMGYARRVESFSLKHEFEMNSECSVGLGDAPSCCPIVIIITQRRRGLATCEGVMTTTEGICTQMKLSREFFAAWVVCRRYLDRGWCCFPTH